MFESKAGRGWLNHAWVPLVLFEENSSATGWSPFNVSSKLLFSCMSCHVITARPGRRRSASGIACSFSSFFYQFRFERRCATK